MLRFPAQIVLRVSPTTKEASVTRSHGRARLLLALIAMVCAGALPEAGRLARCIEANFDRLGDSCRAALVNIATVRQACGADIARISG